MNKTLHLAIRVDPETKLKAAEKAASLGLSISAYVRMLIRKDNRADRPSRRKS